MAWNAIAIAAAIAVAAPVPGAAADGTRTPADKIASACNGSDAACLDRALAAVEAGLNATRKSALDVLNGGALKGTSLTRALELFEAGEKAWLAHRAALCEAYELYDKALGAPLPSARWSCLVNEAIARQSTLRRLFSSE